MAESKYPYLKFLSSSQEELEDDLAYIEMKEYCTIAVLESAEGLEYPVSFVTPTRAMSELRYSTYYIEPGLIIVPKTTLEVMQEAAETAWKEGFFNSLKPIQKPTQ